MAHYSALLVCSGGGHLKQLSLLAPRIGVDTDDALWVTFDTGLSRSLLEHSNVVYATYSGPRDLPNIYRNQALARRILRENSFDVAVSTGASLAVNFLPWAARRGAVSHYIESAARAQGPSLTGGILNWAPGVHTYAQYRTWSNSRWPYAGSVFDIFRSDSSNNRKSEVRKAVVSVGTTESYGFRRFVEKASDLLADVPEVLWQTGPTDLTGIDVEGRESVPANELSAAIAEADVVLTHAGTGIALTCLELGKVPVLVPRLRRYGEHIDDHQVQIAGELAQRDLALTAGPEELSREILHAAAGRSVTVLSSAPPLSLRH